MALLVTLAIPIGAATAATAARSTSRQLGSHTIIPRTTSGSAGWSSGDQIDTHTVAGAYLGLNSVSCPTITFCVAVAGGGYEFTFSNGTWSSGDQIDTTGGYLFSVSCASSTFCVAADSGGYQFTYSDGTWSSGDQIDTTGVGFDSDNSVSCASSTFCMAVDEDGDEFTYSNGAWSSGQLINSDTQIVDPLVSCPSSSFCAAVDDSGYEYIYSNGTWSSGEQIDTTGGDLNVFTSISCVSNTFCVAADNDATVFNYSDGTWSSTKQLENAAFLFVSCPTTSFCIAIGYDGEYFTYSGGTWLSSGLFLPQDSGALNSVSCPATTFCVAVDSNGYAFTYGGGTGVCNLKLAKASATPKALIPPSCFDAATASNADLALYGIPDEPPASNATGKGLWLKMVGNMHWIGANVKVNSGCTFLCNIFGTTNANEPNWAGYAIGAHHPDYFHRAQAIFTEPKVGTCSCDPNDAASFWIGIQSMTGIPKKSSPMGQQGVQVGDNNNENLGKNEAWFETDYGSVYRLNLYATPGEDLYLATSYNNGTYIYFFYNFANGDAESWTATGSAYSGQFVDYIVEKNTSGLSNFGVLHFVQATTAVEDYPIGNYASQPAVGVLSRIYLQNNKGIDVAVPSDLSDGGASFTVAWKRCD